MMRRVVSVPAGHPIVGNVAQSGVPVSPVSLVVENSAGYGPRSVPFCH